MSMSTRVKLSALFNLINFTLFLIDQRKIQQSAETIDDEGAEDLPQIDLNEMLADMTMEDSEKMDA